MDKKIVNIKQNRSEHGIGLIATIMVMLLVMSMVAAIISLITYENTALKNQSDANTSDTLALFGIARAETFLKSDSDWSDNAGILYDSISYLGGIYTVTLSNASSTGITITSVATVDGQEYTKIKTLSHYSGNDAYYLNIDTSGATISGRTLNGIALTSTHPTKSLTVTQMIPHWAPNTGQEIQWVRFDGSNAWHQNGIGSPDGYQPAGTQLDFETADQSITSVAVTVSTRHDTTMVGKNFSYYFILSDGSTKHIDIDPSGGGNQTDYVSVSTVSANITGGSNHQLDNITVSNISTTASIYIAEARVYWEYNEYDRTHTQFRLNNSNRWTGTATPNERLTLTQHTLSPLDNDTLRLRFSDDIRYQRYAFTLIMSDESELTTTVDFRIDQSSELRVQKAGAVVSNNTSLDGINIFNNHAVAKLWIDQMKVTLDPNGGQNITAVLLDGNTVYTGPVAQDTTFNITRTTVNSSTMPQVIAFNNNITNATVNVTYIMRDSTSTSDATNPANVVTAASFFSVSTPNASIENNSALNRVDFITMSNTHTNAITISSMTVSWNPSAENLNRIRLQNVNVYNNGTGVGSGVEVDITDSQLAASSSGLQQYLRFTGSDMRNKDVDVTYKFSDGSSKTVSILMNPSSYFAGDDFESGNGNGGAGFVGNWTLANGANVITSGAGYSGSSWLRLRGSGNEDKATREVNMTASNSGKIKFHARVNGFEAADNAYFEVSVNGDIDANYQILKTFTNADQTGAYVFYEFDLTQTFTFPPAQNFFVRFRNPSNQGNDQLRVDGFFIYE